METKGKEEYLACERKYIFALLIVSAGMMGAYTFNLRGGVFSNAQTANVMMLAIALGKGNFSQALYYLIPISAYCLGAFFSELLPSPVKRLGFLRWDTLLIAFEMAVLFAVGWIPLNWPPHIVQVIINFIASMQYNTFRQAEGIPMATTFCTNHIRQIGVAFAKMLRGKDEPLWQRIRVHGTMVFCFACGAAVLTFFCNLLGAKSIWLALVPLLISLCSLIYADRRSEREKLLQKPHGH